MPGPYGSPAPLKYEIAHGGADPDRVFAIEKKVDTMTAILRDLLAEQTATQMALNKLYERLGGILARLDGER